MQILKRTFVAAALLFATTSAASAQAKAPDFSGQWELNAAKSDLGPAAQFITKLAFTVEQTPATIKFTQNVTTPQGDRSNSQEFTLDGKEVAEDTPQGPAVRSAKVDGDAIVFVGKLKSGEGSQNSRWTLAPDGKTMQIDQSITGPMGAMTMKLVLDKK
jgi:hypothetical protein